MSLSTLSTIRQALDARPAELAAAKAAGGKVVGWLNYNIPEEIIHALGLIPVRLGRGGDERLVELGSRWISTKNCVFVRETVGLFAEKDRPEADPYVAAADLVALDATCLQIFRTAELIKYYFKVQTAVLGVPRNFATASGQRYFRAEVAAFTEALEAFAGRQLEPQQLQASIALSDRIRAAIRQLYRFQAADQPLISWSETLGVVQAGYVLDKARYLALLEDLLREIAARQGSTAIAHPHGEVRVFLSGSLIPTGDRKLIGLIESLGGRIVGDDLWSGLAPSLDVDIQAPTVEAVADAYLGRLPHAALPYLDLASDRRLGTLRKLLKETQAQALIYHSLRYCDASTFKANETKRVLEEDGISFLEIHTEYATSDYEAIRTRIEAFIELNANRNQNRLAA